MPGNNSNLLVILNWHTMSGSAKVRDSQTACISATITVAHSLYLTWCQKFRSLFNHIVKLIHGLFWCWCLANILLNVGNINEIWDLFDTTELGWETRAHEGLASSRDILVDDSIRTDPWPSLACVSSNVSPFANKQSQCLHLYVSLYLNWVQNLVQMGSWGETFDQRIWTKWFRFYRILQW